MTKIKLRCMVAALVVALLAAGFYAIAYAVSCLPRPVLTDPEAVVRTSINVTIFTDGQPEELEDFDEQAVLEFLTTLQKQRVKGNVRHQLLTPTVRITFFDGELDHVDLCESGTDCVYSSTGDTYMSIILDSDRAFREFCEILGVDT